MCGIAGHWDWRDSSSTDVLITKNLLSNLIHRGPDETNVFAGHGGSFGMVRLSINGLQHGLYPVRSQTGMTVAIFNGEIYNYKSILAELHQLGRCCRSDTDGQIIADGYEIWGDNFFRKIRGMWSIALWDQQANELILARDTIGIKPLYFVLSNSMVSFSSEIRPLLNNNQLDKAHNKSLSSVRSEAIAHLMSWMHLPTSESTAYQHISSVLPGEMIRFSRCQIKRKRFQQLDDLVKRSQPIESEDELDSLLTKSVESHMAADVPVALALSGGIDSSLISAIANKKNGQLLHTFTATFSNDSRSEGSVAQQFSKNLGVLNTEVCIRPDSVGGLLESHIELFSDLSTLDGGILTTFLLSQTMREHGYKVCLFGEGADEVFGGYTWFGLGSGIYSALPKRIIRSAYTYANTRSLRTSARQIGLPILHNGFSRTNYSFVQHLEISNQLPSHLLTKIDRATMAASLEGRVPYLDLDLVSKVLATDERSRKSRLRYGLLPDATRTKPMLRSLASRHIGTELSVRPKKGFMYPIDTAVRSQYCRLQDLITSRNSVSREFLDPKEIKKLLSTDLDDMPVSTVWLLWRILVVESVIERMRL